MGVSGLESSHRFGWRRCARALPEVAPERPQPFSRALFVMGHADSVMFHVVEDCVRLHNAKVLGLIPEADPEVDPEHSSTPSLGAATTRGDTCQAVIPGPARMVLGV